MEFFRIVGVGSQERTIQEFLSLRNLDKASSELFVIGDQDEHEAEIGGIWGEFTLARSEIKGGVRFALLECPNALAWTVTTGYPPASDSIIIHLTINRLEKNKEFLEEIEAFLDDHDACLQEIFSKESCME